jgi:ankyrin repeat protein
MEAKEEEVKVVDADGEDEEEEEEEEITGKNRTVLNERLINCVKKGEWEEVERCIKRKADLNYECKTKHILENNKKRWTAFIWACCQGHDRIVRLMISKGAAQQYLEVNPEFRNVVMGATK